MATTKFPFVGPSYTAASPVVDCEETINLYPEKQASAGAKVEYCLLPCPGFTSFATLVQAPTRGAFSQDGRCFFVGGNKFYELSSLGVATDRGTVAVDGYPASICSNGLGGHQVFIVSGDTGYIFDLVSSVFTTVLTGCRFAGFVDGYFLALDVTTSTFKLSALEDGTSWDPLDVAQRSTSGDKWVSMTISNGDVWLFGSETTDVWQDTGASTFPFEPIAGARIQYGTIAPFSVCVLDDVPHWLGGNANGNAIWYRGENYTAVPISTPAVDHAIQAYGTTSDAVSFAYQGDGHPFVVMNFPAAGETWAYDAKEQLFHKRQFWNSTTGMGEAYRPQYHTFCFGKHLVGDRASGSIYEMRSSLSTEVDGTGIRRVRQVPVYAQTPNLLFHNWLLLELESGLGLSTGQGSDPQVALSWSNDGGKTFGNEHWKSAGTIGSYNNRVIWNALGSARGNRRVYRAVMTDPIPWRIAQAFLDTD